LQNSEEFNLDYLPKTINNWPKSSWLKYHTRYCIENNKYFVYPYVSLSTNNGDQGTHVKSKKNFNHSNLLCFKKYYNLPSLDICEVKYDGFFEPKFLSSYLGVKDVELTISLFGTKKIGQTRYLLSTQALPFKIVRTYALSYHPIEANVILNKEGTGIFLYDTHIPNKMKKRYNSKLYEFYYRNAAYKLRLYGFSRLIKLLFEEIQKKIIK
jgi:hypothetical protein